MDKKFIRNLVLRYGAADLAIIAVLIGSVLYFSRPAGLLCLVFAALKIYLLKRSEDETATRLENYEESLLKRGRDFSAAIHESPFIALCVTDRDCELYYTNEGFDRIFEDGEDFRKKAGKNFVRKFDENGNLRPSLIIDGKTYRVSSADIGEINEDRRLLFFENVSSSRVLKKLYLQSRICVAIVSVDNYDELVKSAGIEKRSKLTAEIDKTILADAAKREAAVVKSGNNRYVEIFERKHLQDLRGSGFPILNEMHDIKTDVDFPASVSIGAGDGAASAAELLQYAESALDLALGRGGDQAVIKSRGRDPEFYGGALTTVEKRNKGKSRIVAHALGQLLMSCDRVFIMGHKNPDIDSLGSCIGISAVARGYGVPAHIIMNKNYEGIDLMYKAAQETGLYDFISTEKALELVSAKSLLVVTDVHIPYMTEAPELLEKIGTLALIDHHRRATDAISDPALSFTETYASSASELVTEIAQYSGSKVSLERFDAGALLAGITLDSKNFTANTGVRTFEAASWLRRNGADIAEVRSFFKMDLGFYKKKVNIFASAELLENGVAVAYTKEKDPAMQIIVAQAADELLEMRGVSAAIVAGRSENATVMSARSDGSVNVQLLMEKSGGGGHVNIAAAQVEEGPEEAIATVVKNMREMNGNAAEKSGATIQREE